MWLNRVGCYISSVCSKDASATRSESFFSDLKWGNPAGISWTWIMVVPKKTMDINIQLFQEIKLVINQLSDDSQDIKEKLTRVDVKAPF